MSTKQRLLYSKDIGAQYTDKSACGSGTDLQLSSDKEIRPDQLSDDNGEGHGHGGEKKATLFGSALNIANTVMGAGVLTLPNIIRQFGVILGSSIIVISCIFTYITCMLLLKSKNLSRHSKYISIGKHCFGSGGLWAVKGIIILNNVGLCIVYLIIFSTVASNLLQGFAAQCSTSYVGHSPIYCQQWLLILVAAVIVTPFAFAKSMAKLQFASAIAVIAASIFSVVTFEHFVQTVVEGTNPKNVHFLPYVDSIVPALSSITSVFLAFTFQFNFFPVYKTLQNPTDSRMKQTVLLAFSIVLVIYLSVANAGYLTFGEETSSLLKNFTLEKMGETKFIIVNSAYLVSPIMTFPLMFFGAKSEVYGAIKLIRKFFSERKNNQVRPVMNASDTDYEEQEEDEKVIDQKYGFKGAKYNLFVAILFAAIVLLAIKVPGINSVFSFVGSTAANGLNFLLPTLFYLKLSSKKGKLRAIAAFIFLFGAVMGVVGVVTSAMTLGSN